MQVMLSALGRHAGDEWFSYIRMDLGLHHCLPRLVDALNGKHNVDLRSEAQRRLMNGGRVWLGVRLTLPRWIGDANSSSS